jgi:hypothetical protein
VCGGASTSESDHALPHLHEIGEDETMAIVDRIRGDVAASG